MNETTQVQEEAITKDYVNERLQQRNLFVSKYDAKSLKNRDIMSSIMEARQKDFWETKEVETDYEDLVNQLNSIQLGNYRIEQEVKMELLGLDSNPLKRACYHVLSLIRKWFGDPPVSAQDIMKEQLKRVDSVSQGINQASRVIDERVGKLDCYYDKLTSKLEEGIAYRVVLLDSIEETSKLMDDTQSVLGETDEGDFLERIKYDTAMRKMRKQLQAQSWELKLTDREILDLREELPFIDTFGDFCQTYSFAMKESFQKVQTVKSHLSNVMGLYFEMMRSNHISYALRESLAQLFEYTENMSKSLLRAKSLILDVNQNELVSNTYSKRKEDLEKMVNDVLHSNADTFNYLEDKVKGFLDSGD